MKQNQEKRGPQEIHFTVPADNILFPEVLQNTSGNISSKAPTLMRKNITSVEVDFNNKAGAIYFKYLEDFNSATTNLGLNDEVVFKRFQGKFTYLLRHHLEGTAVSLIEEYKSVFQSEQLNRSFSSIINNLLREFIQKTQAR